MESSLRFEGFFRRYIEQTMDLFIHIHTVHNFMHFQWERQTIIPGFFSYNSEENTTFNNFSEGVNFSSTIN